MAHSLSFVPAQEPLDALAIVALIVVVLGAVAAIEFKRDRMQPPEMPEGTNGDEAESDRPTAVNDP